MNKNYVSPTIEIIDFMVEKGFSVSNVNSTEDMDIIDGSWKSILKH